MLNILIYLTIRDVLNLPVEDVCIEKGEYDTWIPVIETRINRFTKPIGIRIRLKRENKFHRGMLLADHIAGIARSIYEGKLNGASLFKIVKPTGLDYYVKKEFRL